MTEQELKSEIKQDLIDMFHDVDWDRCTFIDFPTFVDIVLKDASRIEDARNALAETVKRLLSRGINLKSVVRGAWVIQSVKYAGAMTSPSGGIMNGAHYAVTLRCGRRIADATVGVWKGAEEMLQSASNMPTREPERTAFLEGVVRSLACEWLSGAPEGRWDPIADPHRVVRAIPLRVALAQSA